MRPTMIRLGLILGLLSVPMSAEAGTSCRKNIYGSGYDCTSDAGSYQIRKNIYGSGYDIHGPNGQTTRCRKNIYGSGYDCN